jgi:hypothetical protein
MAAGLGFKDFTTGEVLTAADVDGYLMQGIWVFDDAAARDAAVTSPEEGNACYLKDTDEVLTYDGSVWVAVGGGSPLTTKGDLFTFSTVDARLAVGANDTVLTADSAEATGLRWATPASSSQNWSLVNSGGTSMSGSAAVTVSGIAGADKLMVCILQASSTGNYGVGIRINNDSNSNRYNHMGMLLDVKSTYSTSIFEIFSNSNGSFSNQISLGKFSSSASSQMTSTVFINGGNSSGVKPFQIQTGVKNSGDANARNVVSGGWYTEADTISSIVVINEDASVNFDSGTLYVFKSA